MPAKRVVVVDDDPKVLELIEWTLRPPEFQVQSFSDPRDALSKLNGLQPHLIICDMMMPDMDGRVFLKIVKRSDTLKDVPFLFLTAVRVGAEVQAAFDAGAAAFLVKPFPVARLVRTIRDVLEANQNPPATSAAPPKAVAKPAKPAPVRFEARATPNPQDLAALQEPTDDDFTQMVAAASKAAAGASVAEAVAPAAKASAAPPPVPLPEVLARAPEPAPPVPLAPPPQALTADATVAPAVSGAPPLERPPIAIEGRFSTVQLDGLRVQVMTEAESRPNFVITTVVSRDGQGVRRIETAWSHPLNRFEDLDLVRRQIDLQHERALDEIRRGPLQGPRRRTIWERDGKQAPS
jgi:CheY-like chemotaxis protein